VTGAERGITRLLIVSGGAKGLTDAVRRKLEAAFPGYVHIDFEPRRDFRPSLTSNATVIVAGGDGTVGAVARALAGSRRRLGILPLGTYNNFARGLAIPSGLDRAIAVVRSGATRPSRWGSLRKRVRQAPPRPHGPVRNRHPQAASSISRRADRERSATCHGRCRIAVDVADTAGTFAAALPAPSARRRGPSRKRALCDRSSAPGHTAHVGPERLASRPGSRGLRIVVRSALPDMGLT